MTYISTMAVDEPSAPDRALRGTLLGGIAWAVVVGAHAAAHGELPTLGSLLATFALAGLLGVALAGRRLTFKRSLATLLLLTPALHLALLSLHGHHSSGGSSGGLDAVTPGAGLTPGSISPATMVAAHVVAAVVTAAWLSWGERAVAVMCAIAGRRRLPAPVVVPASTRSTPRIRHRLITPAGHHLADVRRRGPPVPVVT
jgi:hypothetical protein